MERGGRRRWFCLAVFQLFVLFGSVLHGEDGQFGLWCVLNGFGCEEGVECGECKLICYWPSVIDRYFKILIEIDCVIEWNWNWLWNWLTNHCRLATIWTNSRQKPFTPTTTRTCKNNHARITSSTHQLQTYLLSQNHSIPLLREMIFSIPSNSIICFENRHSAIVFIHWFFDF